MYMEYDAYILFCVHIFETPNQYYAIHGCKTTSVKDAYSECLNFYFMI